MPPLPTRHRNDRGRLAPRHIVTLLALLLAPTLAAARIGWNDGGWFVLIGYAAVSALTWVLYWHDKRRAQSGGWRAPENALHLFELAGGWPGAFLAQHQLRHKVSKASFQLLFWLIVTVHQFVALDYLLDWQMTHAVTAGLCSR